MKPWDQGLDHVNRRTWATHKSEVIHRDGTRRVRKEPGTKDFEVPGTHDQVPQEVTSSITLHCTAGGGITKDTPKHALLILGAPCGALGVGVHDP